MSGVARIVALGVAVGTLTACQTDGLLGPEPEMSAAKPRVIDTPKTLPPKALQNTAARFQSAAPGAATEQGDGGGMQVATVSSERDEPARSKRAVTPLPARADAIPAQSLFGNWTLAVGESNRTCSMLLGGVPIGTAYSARSGPDCPGAFASVQSWEIQGDELILRDQSRAVIGRLQPTAPSRFNGQASNGRSFYLAR